jgi:PAS domain S-box-containing protein
MVTLVMKTRFSRICLNDVSLVNPRRVTEANGDSWKNGMKTNDPSENVNGNETHTASTLPVSELRYRRLFEAAKDGILILNVDTGRITDVNPFLFKLLGFARADMIGKTIDELGPFKDIEPNQMMLERFQKEGYVRYDEAQCICRVGQELIIIHLEEGHHGKKRGRDIYRNTHRGGGLLKRNGGRKLMPIKSPSSSVKISDT